MKLLRVGAAVVNQTPLDWGGNAANLAACVRDAQRAGVNLLCLPELCITGYGCEDEFLSRGVQERALRVLLELVPETRGMIVSVGLPVLFQNAVFNCACLIADKKILGVVAKQYLAGDGIHYEPRWFKPWPNGRHAHIDLGGAQVPIGDLHFDIGGVKIGFEVCEDAWVALRPGGELAQRGIDILLNPSASHFAFDKQDVRERLVLEGSRAFGVTYVYSNLLGNEAGRIIYDGGALIASAGQMLARGPRFSFASHHLTSAVVDLDATRMAQARTASFRPDVPASQDDCVRASFSFPELQPEPAAAEQAAWEQSADIKCEEFTRAVALGLFDYVRKSRSQGLVVSLSGGCDSSVVVCLSALMVELGVQELGLDGFRAAMRHAPRLQDGQNPRELTGQLLTCVYQATRNSGSVTRNAARTVAEAVGAEYFELDVEELVAGYTERVSQAIGRPLTWAQDDVVLQNIQARVRGPSVWMLANLRNALLLATSNRSEAAVGYATMDGDTCGGLSPIAGIDKAFLRRYLVWLEQKGPLGMHPIAALSVVNAQAPTAELRPPEKAQTDEADLMPYDVLDAVERAAIRDKQLPVEVYRRLRPLFPALERETLAGWIERFFRLWSRNQWKRERYAPSFHLDDANLDPKTWCRFPILSSGFEAELTELRAYAKKS